MRSHRLVLLGVAVPWLWFVIRDAGGPLDLAAIVLPLAVASGVGAVFGLAWRCHDPRLVLVGSSWVTLGAAAVVGPWLPDEFADPQQGFTVIEANLDHVNPSLRKGLADVLAQKGDVVVLTETLSPSGPNQHGEEVDRAVGSAYPFSARAPDGDPMVFSRFPVEFDGGGEGPVFRFRLAGPHGATVILASHPSRPHMRRLISQLAAHRSVIESIRLSARHELIPVIVVGDLNLDVRTHTYLQLTGDLRDAMRAGFSGPTYAGWPYRSLLLRIDHILVTEDWCARDSRLFRISGSDHRGISALVGPCPAERADAASSHRGQ